jgi:hypothetical protein
LYFLGFGFSSPDGFGLRDKPVASHSQEIVVSNVVFNNAAAHRVEGGKRLIHSS